MEIHVKINYKKSSVVMMNHVKERANQVFQKAAGIARSLF
jgi:hypothetical protein